MGFHVLYSQLLLDSCRFDGRCFAIFSMLCFSVNAQTYEQRFLILSCFVVNSQKLGQEVDDCKLYEAPHSMRVCTEIYWGRFDPFLFQLLWKNRLGWCSTYCWIWCGKWLNLKQLYFQIDVRSGKKSGRQAFMPNVMQVLFWCHNMKTSYKDKWATSNFPYSFLVRGCNKDLA